MSRSGRWPSDTGAALISALLVMVVLVGLLAVSYTATRHADTASTRDRTYDPALDVAEAGIDRAIARIADAGGAFSGTFSGSTATGAYDVEVTWVPGSHYTVVSSATAHGRLGRSRRVRVTLQPPISFEHVIFSYTDLLIKNNSFVNGSVWANRSVTVEQNATVDGSLVSATSWVDMGNGARITGTVQTGSYHSTELFALRLGNGSQVNASVTASTTTGCPPTDAASSYRVVTSQNSSIDGIVTAIGGVVGPGTVEGYVQACTVAPPAKPMPTFSYNPANYDPTTRHEFVGSGAVAQFNQWKASNASSLSGTFYVQDWAPSQTNRIDLDGVVVTGDVTIVTNAPVFTNGVTDSGGDDKRFVVVTSYDPPPGTECTDQDWSECALHIKNNFDPSCRTSVLMFADPGPAAVKNGATYCGSIYAENLSIKNDPTVAPEAEMQRVAGFGGGAYVPTLFEELPS